MRKSLLLTLSLIVVACSQHRAQTLLSVPENEADAAEEYYAAKRSGTSDPQRAYAIARAQMKESARESRLQSDAAGSDDLKWDFLGPTNVGGRTRTLIIDPTDPNVMYAGGVSGGVWKTTTGGAQWNAIGDELVNLAVNSLAMDPRDHNTLYAGTGEGYFREEVRGTGLPLRGNGIFVTRDAGATWQQLASTANDDDFHWVNDLAVSVHDVGDAHARGERHVPRRVGMVVRPGHSVVEAFGQGDSGPPTLPPSTTEPSTGA